MIITKLKSIEEILKLLGNKESIFIIGCGACASACFTGGENECNELKKKLEEVGKRVTGYTVIDETCHIPLVKKELRKHNDKLEKTDSFIVLACGAGTQAVSSSFINKPVYPGVDTCFLGTIERVGNFTEYCSMCGECIIGDTAGICPVTRCGKGLLNGPCGGVINGKCEINIDNDCVWVLIYNRLKAMGELNRFKNIHNPKNHLKRIKPSSLKVRRGDNEVV